MKRIGFALVALSLVLSVRAPLAQEAPAGDGRPEGPPPPPMISALDANHDGTIDAGEISDAAAALKRLDKNGDGQLAPDEMRPRRPEGARGGGGRNEGGPGGGGPRGGRPRPPIESALDANHDGAIDAQELANASAALKTLDKNSDGALGLDELRPPRREGMGGPDGRGGPGGRGERGEAEETHPPR